MTRDAIISYLARVAEPKSPRQIADAIGAKMSVTNRQLNRLYAMGFLHSVPGDHRGYGEGTRYSLAKGRIP